MPGPAKHFDPDSALMRAIDVFSEHGYDGASLALLTTAMGIGKKSLYDTFGDKRALFLKAIERYTENAVEHVISILTEGGEADIGENLRKLFTIWIGRHGEPGSKGCMLGTCSADFDVNDSEVAAILQKGLKRVEDVFAHSLERAEAADQLRLKVPARDLARTLLCVVQGAALMGRVSTTNEVTHSALNVTLSQFLSR